MMHVGNFSRRFEGNPALSIQSVSSTSVSVFKIPYQLNDNCRECIIFVGIASIEKSRFAVKILFYRDTAAKFYTDCDLYTILKKTF